LDKEQFTVFIILVKRQAEFDGNVSTPLDQRGIIFAIIGPFVEPIGAEKAARAVSISSACLAAMILPCDEEVVLKAVPETDARAREEVKRFFKAWTVDGKRLAPGSPAPIDVPSITHGLPAAKPSPARSRQMLCLKLFHGRKDPSIKLTEWGQEGPTFVVDKYVSVSYLGTIKFDQGDLYVQGAVRIAIGVGCHLKCVDDMIYYDGIYYGDWCLATMSEGEAVRSGRFRFEAFDKAKAELPVVAQAKPTSPLTAPPVIHSSSIAAPKSSSEAGTPIDKDSPTYQKCYHCDHFVEENEHYGVPGIARYIHIDDGTQEYDHQASPNPLSYSIDDWKKIRFDLFVTHPDGKVGANSRHHSQRGKVEPAIEDDNENRKPGPDSAAKWSDAIARNPEIGGDHDHSMND